MEKGRDVLMVVGALAAWGKKWTEGPDFSRITHAECGHGVTVHAYCEECARPIRASEIRLDRIKPALSAVG